MKRPTKQRRPIGSARAESDPAFRESATWRYSEANPWNLAVDWLRCFSCGAIWHADYGPACPECHCPLSMPLWVHKAAKEHERAMQAR